MPDKFEITREMLLAAEQAVLNQFIMHGGTVNREEGRVHVARTRLSGAEMGRAALAAGLAVLAQHYPDPLIEDYAALVDQCFLTRGPPDGNP